MASEEVHMLLGFRREIDKMHIKLRDLKNFLADADRRNITDKRVQEWVSQLKRAMYEAADILDLCQLKAMERGMSNANVGCCNPLLFCMQNPSHAHDIGTRIKALNKRLDIIMERSAAFSFIRLGSYEDRNSKVHGSHSSNKRRETSGEFDRSGVVGEKIEQDTRKLVEIMLSEKEVNTNIMVVAVVGVGGIGKTTLAQKVFNDEALNVEFEKSIWLSINKDFDKVDLLRTIITQAGGQHGREKALAVLQPILATSLKGKKLFLVLDDVWDHEAWDDVLKTSLSNVVSQGSRVLVTTRDERVARRMKAVLPYHHVDKLEEEDAWSLLKKQIISSETDECEIDMLKDIGVQIVGKCDGLPLALKYISLHGCKQFVKLPGSIVKLGQLRYLNFNATSIKGIPRGFCALTNLRVLLGFPTQVDGDCCSLEELGPLSQLKILDLNGLENITTSSLAAKAKLADKVHLTTLVLNCGSILGDDGLIKEEYCVSEEEQQQMENVFHELCPPPRLESLDMRGYFGRWPPRWMMSSSDVPLQSLRILFIVDLACCTQLPDGLCRLPYLEFIQIKRAPAIKCVGPEFMQSNNHYNARPAQMVAAFPRLHKMELIRLVEWEEWDWEEQVQAFPVLQVLTLGRCKLKCLPPGLASQARALNKLSVSYVQGIFSVENFPSLVELELDENLDLERITNLPRLQKLTIEDCPKLKVLEGVPALQRLVLLDNNMETLPEYMGGINPMHFELYCSLALLASIAIGQSGPGWDKFGHVQHVKAYAREGDNGRKWYVLYTAKPYNLETNVSLSFMSTGTLTAFEDAQRFESLFKMRRKTFSYICSLLMGPSMEDMNSYTFVDGRVMSLEDRVAVALRRLQSSDPTESIASSVGVNESVILSVTERFVDTVWEQAVHHSTWPDCSEKDEIKSKFEKIHNMHNCCGVICTTHVPFGPNCNHVKNDCIQMQLVIDPDMRFKNIWLGLPSSMNQSSLLHDSNLFKECEKGDLLNGSKIKVALDGSEVGEYIIGDAGYPLLPWLLTPYKEEDLSDSKAEFNRRHSAATTRALKALARLEDTWKCLHGEAWWPADLETRSRMIYACCRLHNVVIEMEDDAAMLSTKRRNYSNEVRQIAMEDAIRARDMLSQHFMASRSSKSGGTLTAFEDAQKFESVFKMTRKTFSYICSLVMGPSMEDMNSYTFVDGSVLSLQDRVAVALSRLQSSEPTESIASSVGVNESVILSVTERFVDTVWERAVHHSSWPDCSEKDEIKSKFEKIHNMHNCCGVICTTPVPFGPNCNHVKNDCIQMQLVIDPDMRFKNIWLGPASSMNQSSLLHDSNLFKECEKGDLLNGSKLKVALGGSEVGEYIIGDAGYPLLPWLFTPYEEEDLSDSKAEFNRRHSAATTRALKALARLKDTWKCLQGEAWWPADLKTLSKMIYACCRLHNIVIELEDDAAMLSTKRKHYSKEVRQIFLEKEEVRQIAMEDAIRARDMLSQHFMASRSCKSGEQDDEAASSGSGGKNEKQEAQTRREDEHIIN
ncbi:hypothetical protein ZWY2020_015795 [Hordeum vulgare]|nr:hypothetical protein ZWY2020_015795 [Hordeum vulgare]